MLIAFCLGVIAGIAVQIQQSILWEATSYMASSGIALAGLIGYGLQGSTFSKNINRFLIFLCAAALSFGLTGWRSVQYVQTAIDPALEGADIEVVGVVAAMPQRLETGLRFRFDVDAAHLNDKPVALPPRLLLSWYSRSFNDSTGDSAGLDLERIAVQPKAGDRWQMTVRLKAPHGNANPHGFDYELWLWEQGVQATGYVRENKRQTPPRLLGRANWSAVHSMERARQAIRDKVFQRFGDANERGAAGVLSALIAGDQNAIERADWDIFRSTGVAHLMSISGLHITMFAWLAALLLGKLWRRSARWSPRLVLALPAAHAGLIGGLWLATLYAWFSGWGVPAQRTVWMLAAITLLRLSGLRWPWYATWLVAGVLVLMIDPWAMLQAGFWLSFIAVAVLFASDSGQSQKKWWNMLREQWIITLALAPLTLLLFQQVSLVGLLANAIAIPVVTLIVTPLAMLGAVFGPFWDAAAQCLGWLGIMLKWMAGLPYAVYTAPAPPLWLGSLAVLGGILLVLPFALKKRLVAIGAGLTFMLPALLWQPSRPAIGQFEMLAIDIGQGNAVLIKTKSHSLLFDAGPRFSRESDAGHRTIVPLLRALGERLDVLMLSHRDSDHTGGAKAVIAMQPQARVMTSALKGKDRADIGLAEGVLLEPCYAGQSWTWDGVRFDVLHPQKDSLETEQTQKPNAISCVLKITSNDEANLGLAKSAHSVLLTADIEEPQERSLLGAQIQSTVLLVPHHGSKTSSSEAFLDAVAPQFAIVQAGYRNRFAHPRAEIMARYDERKIKTYTSPSCGAAAWKSDAPTAVVCQRDLNRRYWTHRP